eukprot:CAMPEP_0197715780 /NCGR_PEP_ID=MMETSP1434-20131217/888_1 /TAXON_ID=265543 /ORGANISM="Minutocellus polymorphus, Strain CCMP3303" /LENGTH=211 /DNA_ID=CAMNT_0043300007 /DNA_START=224 /DNA_END=859 /DNA_ORIENTATION=-
MASSSASSAAEDYYSNIKSKWVEEYPSSESIDDTWSFYKECGYKDPAATLRSMLDPISFSKKKRILDYGCDKGLMIDFFCSSLEGVEGCGVDINEEAVKYAKKRFPSIKFTVGDGVTIPFPDKHFDCVITIATIKHVRYEDRDKVYAELNRVADYVLLVEADETEKREQLFQGWTFYNSNFAQEFEQSFDEPVRVVREGGDILGLFKCKKA